MSTTDSGQEPLPETPGVEYEVLDFAPPEAVVARIHRLYEEVFGPEDPSQLLESLGRRTTPMAILAREGVAVVGFKVGFEEEPGVFRSWLGAVSEAWQGKGVGAHLLEMQHAWCLENGYHTIRTTGSNGYKAMLMLNLRHGFDVVGTRLARGDLEVLLERHLVALPAEAPPDEEPASDDGA